jgi:hypothetical protein
VKPFQPMNVTEHLQALYNAGHDWAQEALGAVELFVESSETLDLADDLRRVLGLDDHCDAYTIVRQVEIAVDLLKKAERCMTGRLQDPWRVAEANALAKEIERHLTPAP